METSTNHSKIKIKMASEEVVRTVRCSRLELEKLALELEKPRGKTREKVPRSSSKSDGKNRKDFKVGGEKKKSNSDRYQNKATSTNCDDNKSGKKLSRSSKGVLCVDTELLNHDSVVANEESEGKAVTKNARLSINIQNNNKSKTKRDSQNLAANSDSASGDDYDRGESNHPGAQRSLYDPLTNNSTSKSTSHKRKTSYNASDKPPKQNITDMMGKLHVESSEGDLVNNVESNGSCLSSNEKKECEDRQQNLRKMQRKEANTLFSDLGYLEGDLDNLLSRRLSSEKQLYHVLQLSNEIQEKCKSIMLTDLHFFTTKEVYHMLWKSGFYHVVERLRGLQKDNQDHNTDAADLVAKITSILQEYLNSASTFIRDMVTSLEKEHDFLLKSFLEKPAPYDGCNRLVKMALLCCHHFMIFLGDLERYKIQLLSVKEWSVARSCYLKASKIAPRNGKPYNQLAVIAVYAKRRLDAVYYYIRSLAVRNPIMTAREKLVAIFDDVQRKAYELHTRAAEEMDGTDPRCQGNRANEVESGPRRNGMRRRRCQSEGKENAGRWAHEKKAMADGRHELWVFYRGGVRREFLFTADGLVKGGNYKEENCEKQEKAAKISLNEIMKQFEVFYLCAHAMLYTKVGIDHFSINHRKLLGLFKTLLRHPTCPAVGPKRLVEMMAINIFEIANMTSEDCGQLLEGTPLDLTITLGCDMFQCVCKASTEILLQHSSSSDENSPGDELYPVVLVSFLPAIKVWFDWMRNCITLFRSSSVSIKEDFWNCVSVLLNSLSPVLDELTDIRPGDVIETLMEDEHLSGFKLLAEASKPCIKVESHSYKDKACKKLRIEAIQSSAKFLCEFEDLPLRFDAKLNCYHVTEIGMARGTGNGEQERVDEINEEDIEDDVIVESVEDYDSDPELANPVKELKAKKDALTKEILNQKQREEDAKAVLVEHSNKPTLDLEINPQYLVPDTNCFIDHLSDLQYIVESRLFTIVIPLVVINELDGLAKGSSGVEHIQQRGQLVAEHARAAIDFLENCFSLGDSQMLALTSKGSVLSTIAFRIEEPTEGRGINDDVILNCCHHYCESNMDVVNKLASADQPFTIRRKVVLLTEDRNLCLKAHVKNIPVVTVPNFLEMIIP